MVTHSEQCIHLLVLVPMGLHVRNDVLVTQANKALQVCACTHSILKVRLYRDCWKHHSLIPTAD